VYLNPGLEDLWYETGVETKSRLVCKCGYCGTVFGVNYCEFGGEPTPKAY